MMHTKHIILLAIVVLSSCRDDSVLTSVTMPDLPDVEDVYVKDLHGLVIDENHAPVGQAVVRVGNTMTTTDDLGIWKVEGVSVNRTTGTYVAVAAENHFAGGTRLYSNNGIIGQVVTTLVPYGIPQIFNTSSPTIIETARASIDFTNAAFVTDDEVPYRGSVSVYAYHLDPSAVDFLERSPGDLVATNLQGEQVGLQSYGMLAVEMRSASGDHLQIAESSHATIRMVVPSQLLDIAPTLIPLWSYDEVLGLWIEEGEAILQGNTYVGEVGHFSWWNCDVEIDPIILCIELIQPEFNNELQGVNIVLCDDRLGSAEGTTDGNGSLCGIVPRDRIITLKILNACDSVVHMESIGPFAADADYTVNYIPDPTMYTTLQGAVTSCDPGIDLSDMVVTIATDYDRFLTTVDAQGNYTREIVLCGNTLDYEVSATSLSNELSAYGTGVATAAGPNLLDLDICDDLPLLVVYDDLGTILFSANEVTLAVKPNETLITITDGVIGWAGRNVGTFAANVVLSGGIQAPKSEGTTVTVSSWGDVGSMVSGTFVGVSTLPGQVSSFTGEFIARRTE